MKNFVVVLFCLLMLSGCSLFRKTEKTVTTTLQTIERFVDTTLTIIPDEKKFSIDNIENSVRTDTLVFSTLSGTGKFFKTETSPGVTKTSFVFEPKNFDVPIQVHERVTTEKKEKVVVKEPTIPLKYYFIGFFLMWIFGLIFISKRK